MSAPLRAGAGWSVGGGLGRRRLVAIAGLGAVLQLDAVDLQRDALGAVAARPRPRVQPSAEGDLLPLDEVEGRQLGLRVPEHQLDVDIGGEIVRPGAGRVTPYGILDVLERDAGGE